jgi:MFS family permease
MPSPHALKYREYRLLWTGSLFTYAGHWINQVTMGWVAYDITGSGTVLGAILGVRAIPVLLLAPLSGIAADRYSCRAILALSNLLNVIVALALGALLALGLARVWHLFVFVIIIGAGHVFDRTTRHVAMQELVPRDAVMNAVALNSIAFSLMRVLSPAIAGYLIAWFSSAVNFFVQGLLYALAVALVFLIRFPQRHVEAHSGPFWDHLTAGMRFARKDRTTGAALLFTAVPFFFLVPTWGTLLPLYARDVFQAGPEGLGWLLTAVGIGGVAGGLSAAALSRFDRLGRLQIAFVVVFVAALVGVALSPTVYAALVFVVLAGIGEMVSISAGQTILQLTAPAAIRGRILSLLQFNPALISIGSLLAGGGADLFGPRGITLAACAAALLSSAALVVAAPFVWTLRASVLEAERERRL